jgi:hypothetical protein
MKKHLLLIGVFFMFLIAVLAAYVIKNKSKSGQKIQRSTTQIQDSDQKYFDKLWSKLTDKDFVPNSDPVIIVSKTDDGGFKLICHGLYVEKADQIVTCYHAFWDYCRNGPAGFYYIILKPGMDRVPMPINRIKEYENKSADSSVDAIVCIPGELKLISPQKAPASEVRTVEDFGNSSFTQTTSEIYVYSSLTGEKHRALGIYKNSVGIKYTAIDKSSRSGESGTVFIDLKHNYMFVLSHGLEFSPKDLEAYRKVFQFKKGVTFTSSIVFDPDILR